MISLVKHLKSVGLNVRHLLYWERLERVGLVYRNTFSEPFTTWVKGHSPYNFCGWPTKGLLAKFSTAEFTFYHLEQWISCNNYFELLRTDLIFLYSLSHCQMCLFQGSTWVLGIFTVFLKLQQFCFIFGVYGSSVWDCLYVSRKKSKQHIKQVFLATVRISDVRFISNCFVCWLADFGLKSP